MWHLARPGGGVVGVWCAVVMVYGGEGVGRQKGRKGGCYLVVGGVSHTGRVYCGRKGRGLCELEGVPYRIPFFFLFPSAFAPLSPSSPLFSSSSFFVFVFFACVCLASLSPMLPS